MHLLTKSTIVNKDDDEILSGYKRSPFSNIARLKESNSKLGLTREKAAKFVIGSVLEDRFINQQVSEVFAASLYAFFSLE